MELITLILLILILLFTIVLIVMLNEVKREAEEVNSGLMLVINALNSLTNAENSIFEYLKKNNKTPELHDDGK